MLNFLNNLLFGANSGITSDAFSNLLRRSSFSDYLNYVAYDEASEIYWNMDHSLGAIWECTPLSFAGTKTLKSLEGLFKANLPQDSVVQIILHADDYLDPIIDWFEQAKTREGSLISNYIQSTKEFARKGKNGINALADIPLRNFRVYVAVKVPRKKTNKKHKNEDGPHVIGENFRQSLGENVSWFKDIKRQIQESLVGAGMHPVNFAPEYLLAWARRLFNSYPDDYPQQNFSKYDPTCPIKKQIINSDTDVVDHGNYLKIGGKYFCCVSPKTFPKEVNPMQTNSLFGGAFGMISDADQIRTPFLYSFNVVFRPLKKVLHTKCNFILQQQGVGSFSPSLRRKQEEYLSATDDLEKGVLFIEIMPLLLLWSNSLEKTHDSVVRVRRMWENQDFLMQQDVGILKALFLAALPLGLLYPNKNVPLLCRHFIVQAPVATVVIPNQADFIGAGNPKMLFVGRKGQLASIDFFDKRASNNNIFITAGSGKGKSFLVNSIAFNYYAAGALIRIVDIGGSYKKMTTMLGARFLDFSPGTDICLNPFTKIRAEDTLELDGELNSVVAVIAQMAYSNSAAAAPSDIEYNLLRSAVRWAWRKHGNDADVNGVYHFLAHLSEIEESGVEDIISIPEIVFTAQRLAFNMREFTSAGPHGKFFTGPSTFDISTDQFVVLELEHLKPQKELYRVVMLLVINLVTQDLYLSDRSKDRLCIFDEAWQFLGEGAMLKNVISEGYRRARKYRGSFCIVTQSLLDLQTFGPVGDVIRANSDWKIMLESSVFTQANDLKLIDYDPFTMEVLQSVKSAPPRYSELFFDTPFGKGVLRLVVDPYTYYLYTSNGPEIAEIESFLAQGFSYDEAIKQMVAKYHS